MSSPLFSIVTPSFNAGPKLEHSYESVMGQARGLFDYWIIDGASSDGTAEWLQSKSDPAFHYVSEKDAGVYDAMNKGIRHSAGRFLLFLGAGDRLLLGILERIAEFIDRSSASQPRFIYGDVRDLQTGGPFTTGQFSKARVSHVNICHQGIFYERSIFDLIGDYELKYPIMSDWAFNLSCFGDSRVQKMHFPEYVADFEGGGLCSHTPDMTFYYDQRRLIKGRLGCVYAVRHRVEEALIRRLRLKSWYLR